jgi:hypothetical protein
MAKSGASRGNLSRQRPEAETGAGAPVPAKCRAEEFGFKVRSAWCLVKSPKRCSFAVPFAGGFICCHPQRERIVARTLAEKQSRPR